MTVYGGREIGWGILGTGIIAGQFAEALSLCRDARLRAVGSRSREKAAEFARVFGAVRAYGSLDEVCADPAVEVVFVATPKEHRRDHCLLAIEAGKAVLCEKPLATTLVEAREVIEAARRRQLFCMEGMWMRCAPAFRRVVDLVQRGALGEIGLLDAELGFANLPERVPRLFAPPAGGALLDLGVYPISFAQALFGLPSRLSATATFGATGVDEWVSALLEFPQGVTAKVSASLRSHLGNGATVYGSRARLEVEAPLYFPTVLRTTEVRPLAPARVGGSRSRGRLQRLPGARRLLEPLHRLRAASEVRTTRDRPAGTGLACEAEEVMRCLRAQLTESPFVSQQATLEVAEIVDRVRAAWSPRSGASAP